MANRYDPRFLTKTVSHGKRAIVGRVESTFPQEWGVGGLERQQPRFMEGDEGRPPLPHPYFKYPESENRVNQGGKGPPIIKGRRGNKYASRER